MRQRLYWCVTKGGDRDYWVVARSWKIAAIFFADQNGFEVQEVGVAHVLSLPDEPAELPLYYKSCSPEYPNKRHLAAWGVNYCENFHVFEHKGRIYRPEGIVRALMQSNARVRHELRTRPRPQAHERL